MYRYVHVSTGTHRVHKRAADILHLELQAVLPDVGAAPKFRLSGRGVSILNHQAIFLAPDAIVLKNKFYFT